MKIFILITILLITFFGISKLADLGADKVISDESKQSLNWHIDFEKAKEASQASGWPILMDFTGSDWCGWCIKLKDEVFNKAEFIDHASEQFVLMEVDFPRSKGQQDAGTIAQNNALKDRYRVRGFPTIILVNAQGVEIARTGYQRGGPSNYIKHLEDLLGSN